MQHFKIIYNWLLDPFHLDPIQYVAGQGSFEYRFSSYDATLHHHGLGLRHPAFEAMIVVFEHFSSFPFTCLETVGFRTRKTFPNVHCVCEYTYFSEYD